MVVNVGPTDPEFGKLIWCGCAVARNRRWERARKLCNLAGGLQGKTFDTFRRELAPEAYDAARAYADDPTGWLVMHGLNGNGKSHLAVAVCNHLLAAGRFPIFAVVPSLVARLRSMIGEKEAEQMAENRRQVEALLGADVLVLDDLGAENQTDWAAEQLFNIVNHRYNERLPLIVTTNVIPTLQRVQPRLHSRLLDTGLSRYVHVKATDYRLAVR